MTNSFSLEQLAKLDYVKGMMLNLNLDEEGQSKNLTTQSMQGHIASGHGIFSGNQIKDVFIEDVYKMLGIDPETGRKEREEEIIEVFDLVDRLIDGKTNQFLKSDGSPIMGFKPFLDYKIKNNDAGLKGAYIMGCVDDSFWRADTIQTFKETLDGEPLKIGYGKEYLVDKKVMKELNLGPDKLSKNAFSKQQINQFRRNSMIVRNPGKNIENIFIRRNKGLGCCDDLMLNSIGLIHNKDAMVMGWALDALDTYTKFIMNPLEGGYDQVLAKRINDKWLKKYGEPIARPEEIREIIYLGAKENTPKINLSSSHSRFIRNEKGQPVSTIENHIKFVETGIRPKEYKLGFDQVSSEVFYNTLQKRFDLHGKGNLIKTPKEFQNERKSRNR